MRTFLVLALVSIPAFAQNSRPLETVEEAQRRHEAGHYEQYRQRGNNEPLGGYTEKLGDPYNAGGNTRGQANTMPAKPSTWQDRAKGR